MMSEEQKKTTDKRNLILIVDDDARTRDILKRRLATLEYEVLGAAKEEDALPLLKDNADKIFAILLDLRLHGGLDASLHLLDQIKKETPLIPVIAYSAYESDSAMEAVRRGACWFIDKVMVKDKEFAVVINSLVRTWELLGRMVDAEVHRDFLQRVIDSIPYEIMVRDRAGVIHCENRIRTEKYGDPFHAGKDNCKHRYEDNCPENPCPCKDAFLDGKTHSRYYTWRGKGTIQGAELDIVAAPAGKNPEGKDVVVETVKDVSCQVGFQELIQKVTQLSRTDRQTILNVVVKHLIDKQDQLVRANGEQSQAKIGFMRARAYLVTPRCGDERIELKAYEGEYPRGFVKDKIVFTRKRSPYIGNLWEHPNEVWIMYGREMSEGCEKVPDDMIGHIDERVLIPISVRGRLEGLVVADKLGKKDRSGRPDENIEWEELHWCRLLAEHLSSAFETVYQMKSLRWLLQTEQQMAEAHSSQEMYQVILKPTKDYFEADMVGVHLVKDDETIELVASLGHSENCPIGRDGYMARTGPNVRACKENKSEFIEDLQENETFRKCEEESVKCSPECSLHSSEGPIRSVAAIPFGRKDSAAGSLYLAFKSHRTFDPIDMDVLNSLGASLSVAFAAVRAEERAGETRRSLVDLYRACAGLRSESTLIQYCLTYLTAGQALTFNRALFFGYTSDNDCEGYFSFKAGIGQKTVEEFKKAVSGAEHRLFADLLQASTDQKSQELESSLKVIKVVKGCSLFETMSKDDVSRITYHAETPGLKDALVLHVGIGMTDVLVVGIHVDDQPHGAFVVDRAFTDGLVDNDVLALHAFSMEASRLFQSIADIRDKERRDKAEATREREMWKSLTCRAVHRLGNVLPRALTPIELHLRYKRGFAEEAMNRSKGCITDTLEIIDSMRDFSRFESVRPDTWISVSELAGRLLADLREAFSVKGIAFVEDSAFVPPSAMVHVDYRRLVEEFMALTENSLKHSGLSADKLKICVGARGILQPPERPGEKYACIYHADNGRGVVQSARSTIFTPFVSTESRSMGLGLYILKEVLEAHGGWVELDTETDKGAKFNLWLPIQEKE